MQISVQQPQVTMTTIPAKSNPLLPRLPLLQLQGLLQVWIWQSQSG
jgi:hypothetical protein